MIADYETNAVYMSSWLKKDYGEIYMALQNIFKKHNVAYDIIPDTKDVWCRDYMPLQLDKDRFLCYTYKPDYLLKNPQNRKYITDSVLLSRRMNLKVKESSLIIDGGNVVKIGNKVIMTEKVFVENPRFSEKGLVKRLQEQLECEVVFIPWDRNEIYGHSDGVIKPISDEAVLMTNYHDYDKGYSQEVIRRLSGKFDVNTLSYHVNRKDSRSWAYINFLTVGNLIVLPCFGIEEDEQALSQIRLYYPHCIIEQVNIALLVKDGGGLNCVTWCRSVSEDERRFLNLYNRMESENSMGEDSMYSDEEIIFMCKYNLRRFAEKYPGIAEYYMTCLDD